MAGKNIKPQLPMTEINYLPQKDKRQKNKHNPNTRNGNKCNTTTEDDPNVITVVDQNGFIKN